MMNGTIWFGMALSILGALFVWRTHSHWSFFEERPDTSFWTGGTEEMPRFFRKEKMQKVLSITFAVMGLGLLAAGIF